MSSLGGHGAASIGNTATPIGGANESRQSLLIYNNGGETVWVGGSSVTVADGMPIPPGIEREMRIKDQVYGVVVTGPVDVRWMDENIF